MMNPRYAVNQGPFSLFFTKPFQVEQVHLTDARQRKEMGEFHWLSNKVDFARLNEIFTALFSRTIFAVGLNTGKGRLILKDFVVVGEKGKKS